MSHYRQSIIIAAKPDQVYAALTTAAGLRSWWTQDCDIEGKLHGRINLRFGGSHKELQSEILEPGQKVQWLCTGAHIDVADLKRKDEWVGTQLVFNLASEAGGCTRLDFEHLGLVPSFECYTICNQGWQYFLNSLQQLFATGQGTPHQSGGKCESHSLTRS